MKYLVVEHLKKRNFQEQSLLQREFVFSYSIETNARKM